MAWSWVRNHDRSRADKSGSLAGSRMLKPEYTLFVDFVLSFLILTLSYPSLHTSTLTCTNVMKEEERKRRKKKEK
jgi:hypothetical protein